MTKKMLLPIALLASITCGTWPDFLLSDELMAEVPEKFTVEAGLAPNWVDLFYKGILYNVVDATEACPS